MIRYIDNLGRIVILKEMRDKLNINNGDPIHMELQGDKIILTNPNYKDEFEEWLIENNFNGVLEKYKELKK